MLKPYAQIAFPPWYQIAMKEIGVKEIPGKENTARIVEYHDTTGLSADDDETSWCSSFVNWCMKEAGILGTNSASARSWHKWADELSAPVPGCVAVLWRGTKDSWQGHVGFFLAEDADSIVLLGGNQGNKVSFAIYPKYRVLSYRWPAIA